MTVWKRLFGSAGTICAWGPCSLLVVPLLRPDDPTADSEKGWAPGVATDSASKACSSISVDVDSSRGFFLSRALSSKFSASEAFLLP